MCVCVCTLHDNNVKDSVRRYWLQYWCHATNIDDCGHSMWRERVCVRWVKIIIILMMRTYCSIAPCTNGRKNTLTDANGKWPSVYYNLECFTLVHTFGMLLYDAITSIMCEALDIVTRRRRNIYEYMSTYVVRIYSYIFGSDIKVPSLHPEFTVFSLSFSLSLFFSRTHMQFVVTFCRMNGIWN